AAARQNRPLGPRVRRTMAFGQRQLRAMVVSGAAAMGLASPLQAQEAIGPAPPGSTGSALQEVAKNKENPFAQTINLPSEAATGFGVGPRRDIAEELSIQPLLPFALNNDWNLIVRPLLPLTYSPTPEKRFGLGDIQPSFFLTPARVDQWTWGA